MSAGVLFSPFFHSTTKPLFNPKSRKEEVGTDAESARSHESDKLHFYGFLAFGFDQNECT